MVEEVELKVMIIGGTGFLGYYATLELISRGHKVSIIALPPAPAPGLFPSNVEIHLEDLNALSDNQLEELLKGQDALVFAAGVDDRVTPRKPAYPFFYKHNVESVRRLFTIAKHAGLKKGIVLGSYFAYFDRAWPKLQLSRHHPYIRSRVEQTRAAIEAGGDELAVSVLELPYIFGSMPGRTPLWKPLIAYIQSGFPLFYPAGGTACVTVQQVAKAIRGAVENGTAGERYPIGGTNLSWVELLGLLGQVTGKKKKVITLPTWIVKTGAWILKITHSLKGLESGLDLVEFIKLQTSFTYLDPGHVQKELDYPNENIVHALEETVEACQ
jgi:dihydroflavonol-4-reductase